MILWQLSLFSALLGIVFWDVQAGEPPYPPSPVITNAEWAPASQIIRKASGSDGWATAWGQDNKLYTAYADGYGFNPKVSTKLSLGFASVEGTPSDFSGVNIRSSSGEMTGSGRNGRKASGMLMVDEILYMFVRNVDLNGSGCQLAVSTDSAITWQWASWVFEDFGYCTFLDFGKNYADARDSYVYMYSHNGQSAYEPADNMILARTPKTEIEDESAYEFFSGLMQDGTPRWSSNISDRAPVFEHSGLALRSGISFNREIDRYIWWQQIPVNGSDTRFSGGFGIYDAPEPWGPWTTVYFTESWDVGPGESGRFPTKWMSADGKTMHLVFSGDDNFSVRKLTLTIDGEATPAPKPPSDVIAN